MRVAVLEDNPARAILLEQTLRLSGHEAVRFREGGALMQALRSEPYALLLMAWEVPGIPARDVLLWIRRTLGDALPVMLLSQHNDDDHIARCFAHGADAFLPPPVRHAELAARVDALLRRMAPVAQACGDLELGAYRFVLAERRAFVNGRLVKLAPKEYELAVLLFRHAGQLLLRQTIEESVWHRSMPSASRTVDSHLSRVRTKLALEPRNGVRLSAVYATGCRLDLIEQP
ncbi:response regulator transcription factor [Cupriavidus basilensis]|uniref:response regulator transcription factor n=1 Tax=Cupriavidus basilensis TaxID=68895 RepID=UPI00157BA96C|nr:response regulator transcription factor [Cupriavidus basilensis]NUA28847.1 response regulator transcription factor [Cupriavidus basilensis]